MSNGVEEITIEPLIVAVQVLGVVVMVYDAFELVEPLIVTVWAEAFTEYKEGDKPLTVAPVAPPPN